MKIIAKQPYIKVIREVSSIGKSEREEERTLYLHEEKIVTAFHEFPLHEVFDLSYRKIGEKGGLLFIHTNHGVYSYTVTSSPEKFIVACKNYMNGHC